MKKTKKSNKQKKFDPKTLGGSLNEGELETNKVEESYGGTTEPVFEGELETNLNKKTSEKKRKNKI